MLSSYGLATLVDEPGSISANPSISDNGTRIAFISDANLDGDNTELRPEIFYYDTLAHTFNQVTDAPSVTKQLAISGDGQRIAFVAAADLTGENSDGSFEIFLYDIPTENFYQATRTEYALDSSRMGKPRKTNLWLNQDGTRLMYLSESHQIKFVTDLTTSPVTSTVFDTAPLVVDQESAVENSHVGYSRDGSRFAISSSQDLTGNGTNSDGNSEIFIVNISSGTPVVQQITYTQNTGSGVPALNGDGSKVAFNSNVDLTGDGEPLIRSQVYLYDLSTSVFTSVPHTVFGGVPALDRSGNQVASQNISLPASIFNVTTGEVAQFNGGGLPIGLDNSPLPLDGIPPVIPINPDTGITISAGGQRAAYAASSVTREGVALYLAVEQFPPIATPDLITTPEDTDVRFNVLDNDSDPNGGTLQLISIGGEEMHGHATYNPVTGDVIYRPDDDYFGPDAFTYQVQNSFGLTSHGTVFINVLPVNDAPVAFPDGFDLPEDQTLSRIAPGVLVNDSDVEATPLIARLVREPSHGSLRFDTDGSFSYTPDSNFNGFDEFVYVASDGTDDSAESTVTLHVIAVNDPPVNSLPASFTALEDVPTSITGLSVLDIDANEGNGILEVSLMVTSGRLIVDESVPGGLVPAEIYGSNTRVVVLTGTQAQINATLSAPAGLVYLGDENYFGGDSLRMETRDLGHSGSGGAKSDVDSVLISVLPVNDPPVAADDYYQQMEDLPVAQGGQGVLTNDFDVEGDLLTVRLLSGTSHGQLTLNPDGTFSYLPDENFNGMDQFVYVSSDGEYDSEPATVMLKVVAVNDPPVNSLPASVTGYEDVVTPITGVSVRDVDAAEGDGHLEVTLQIDYGTLTVDTSVAGGLAATDVQGNGSAVVVLNATQEQINKSLSAPGGLSYFGGLDFSGDVLLTITTNDLGNFGLPGPRSDIDLLQIHVLSSVEQIELLAQTIASLDEMGELQPGGAVSLTATLSAAQSTLDRGNDAAAINTLRALGRQIEALAYSGDISDEDRDELLNGIGTIIIGIGVTDEGDADDALLAAAEDAVFADVQVLQELLIGL